MTSTGVVHTGRNNIYTVETTEGQLLCRIKGKVLDLAERAYNPLAPGDTVEVESELGSGEGVISSRLPRRNAFSRFNTKRSALQTLAANIDLVVIVASVSDPQFLPDFVDRATVLSSHSEVPAMVVVTKRDLDPTEADRLADTYLSLGFKATALSLLDGDEIGALRLLVKDSTTMFVGQSGVGKSTLLNRLVGEDRQLTAAVSVRHHSGRHTTNAAELIGHDSYRLIDTPGVRELDCRHLESNALDFHFPEFRPFLGKCGHNDCRHASEPDCAVRDAVGAGRVAPFRHASYLRILSEVVSHEEQDW